MYSCTQMIEDLDKRIKSCILGAFNYFEVTEIVGFQEKSSQPINLFSLLVAEEGDIIPSTDQNFLNPKRIRIKSLKGWFFGIFQYTLSIDEVFGRLGSFANNSTGLSKLKTSELTPICPQFIPADSTEIIPLNKILKNNFHSGSHVLEFFDTSKMFVQALLEKPVHLKELSESIQKYLPLSIGSLSDRLGNIIIQIPVHTVVLDCRGSKTGCTLSVHWRPDVQPKECILYVEETNDNVLKGATCHFLDEGEISCDNIFSISRAILFDKQSGLILSAYAPTGFMRQINLGYSINKCEYRKIVIQNSDGANNVVKVGITTKAGENRVGEAPTPERSFVQKRIYAEDRLSLLKKLEFKQYGLASALSNQEKHESALEDLRTLIRQHGKDGVWLWDPYLSAHDIMETLFHCSIFGAELRALALNDRETREQAFEEGRSAEGWIQEQKRIFNTPGNSYYGLNCEFKVAFKSDGLDFHDRFLIFPVHLAVPLVWSLGTSVNSLGKSHHILQKVSHGQHIVDAFLFLWNQLDDSHIVWKHSV